MIAGKKAGKKMYTAFNGEPGKLVCVLERAAGTGNRRVARKRVRAGQFVMAGHCSGFSWKPWEVVVDGDGFVSHEQDNFGS